MHRLSCSRLRSSTVPNVLIVLIVSLLSFNAVAASGVRLSPAPALAVRVDEERVDSVVVRTIRKRALVECGFEALLDLADLFDHLVERVLAKPDRHHA